jgi:hypothetical protein
VAWFKGWLEKRRKRKALTDWEDQHGLEYAKLGFQLAKTQLRIAIERKQLNRGIIDRKGKDDCVSFFVQTKVYLFEKKEG